MTPAYLAEVERAFVQHAGRGLILSPIDRERVAGWARAGIPAAVVISGIANAFDRDDLPRVRGLGFAVPAIEARIKAWRQGQVGRQRTEVDPNAAIAAAFAGLKARVEAAGRRARDPEALGLLRRMWRTLTDIEARWSAGAEPDPITAVFEAEQRMLDESLRGLDPTALEGIEREVDMALDGFSIHDEATRRITRRALMHEALRQRLGLPDLELRL